MNLTSEKEKIQEWAEQNRIINNEWSVFPGAEVSYWKQREKATGIVEYDFSNIREVKEKLHKQWEEEEVFGEIEQVLSITALKAKEKEEVAAEIPVFVYVF